MTTVQISLNSIDKVKSFVNDISKFNSDFDLVSGRYVIDAKSIMGIFSLDLSKPITLSVHSDTETDNFMRKNQSGDNGHFSASCMINSILYFCKS